MFFSPLDIKSRFALWNCRNKSTLKFVEKRGCMYICYAVHSQTRTRKLQQVCYRLDRTCDLQADIKMRSHRLLRLDNIKSVASCQQICCKLWTADLLQVVVHRLAASCELQTWCKLWTVDLMPVVNYRLDASCELQTWCKLSSTNLTQVVKRLIEKSALWSFVYPLFWTKNGQTSTLPYFSCSVS
jgi:hypothetical protein